MTDRHGAVQRGDAMAVWVRVRVAQLCRDALLEVLGDEVLQALGFVVQVFDGIPQYLKQEGLDQAMVPYNLQRTPPPDGGEAHTAAALVVDHGSAFRSQLLQHVGDGRGRHAQPQRQL